MSLVSAQVLHPNPNPNQDRTEQNCHHFLSLSFAACFLCAPIFCQSISLCVVSLCFSLTLCQFVCFCPGVALSNCLVYCSSFCMDVAYRFVPSFVFSYLLALLSLRLLCMHLDVWILALLMMMPFVFELASLCVCARSCRALPKNDTPNIYTHTFISTNNSRLCAPASLPRWFGMCPQACVINDRPPRAAHLLFVRTERRVKKYLKIKSSFSGRLRKTLQRCHIQGDGNRKTQAGQASVRAIKRLEVERELKHGKIYSFNTFSVQIHTSLPPSSRHRYTESVAIK